MCRGRVEMWEAGLHPVKRVLDHRVVRGGLIEYEIEWLKKKNNGEPWPLDWVAADALTPDLVDGYNRRRMRGVPPLYVSVDASLVYEEVRRRLAEVIMNGAPTKHGFTGRNRPRVQKIFARAFPLAALAPFVVAYMLTAHGVWLSAVRRGRLFAGPRFVSRCVAGTGRPCSRTARVVGSSVAAAQPPHAFASVRRCASSRSHDGALRRCASGSGAGELGGRAHSGDVRPGRAYRARTAPVM